jgi:hypothetical protein
MKSHVNAATRKTLEQSAQQNEQLAAWKLALAPGAPLEHVFNLKLVKTRKH